ncbi:MAG: hypothetical protein EOO19_11370 [Chryseobacterium sp.]|nr:MAG: hypothetical protein EOO19_11370 [Chryseobacterium sp.]
MKIRHHNFSIPEANPFQMCVLDREKYAKALTSLIANYKSGFVLSINNPWGTGKTTFIKMWQRMLINNSFQTLYFNAWENDYDSDPLVAIISELKSLHGKKDDAIFKNVLQKAAMISKNIAPGLIKALAEKYIKTEVLLDAIKGVTEGTTEIFKEEVDNYARKKQGLVEFREELEKYIDATTNDKPLVFIIDELDRCRPDYAVQVLEQVKHFFNVPGIVFVLSIDKVQLGNAIKGFYGSDAIDTHEYLRRFIDTEFSLPAPESAVFAEYLFKYFDFNAYFQSESRKKIKEIAQDGKDFITFSSILFANAGLTLRQQEKIMASARLVLNTFLANHYLYPAVFVLLIYIKDYFPSFYLMLLKKDTRYQDILDELKLVYPKEMKQDDFQPFLYVEVQLMLLYHNSLQSRSSDQQLTKESSDYKLTLLIKSTVDKSEEGKHFLSYIEEFTRQRRYSTSLNHLTDRINLMQEFVSDNSITGLT